MRPAFPIALGFAAALGAQTPAPHWAFVAPRRPPVPAVQRAGWARTPIDAFVLARLEREGVPPAAEADRATLLRRLAFDLTGLPPTIEELDAFLADPRADAYERTVETLLASPRAAEHQARIWLDAARYGDTHGMEADWERTLWPWRDQLIAAFQRNQPFDQFTSEQLAGDLLPGATEAQRIASGFHRNGRSTAEGGLIEAEQLANYAAERAEVTGTVWLGLTLGCARCHDHKYDPILQRDYYALTDFFHSIDEQGSNGNAAAPQPNLPVVPSATQAQIDELQGSIDELRQGLARFPPEAAAEAARFAQATSAALRARWQVLAIERAAAQSGAALAVQPDGSIVVGGALRDQDDYELTAALPAGGLGALRLEALRDGGRGPGRDTHGNFVLTDLRVELVLPDGGAVALPLASATADFAQRGFAPELAIDRDPTTGWAIGAALRDHALVCGLVAPPTPPPADARLRIRLAFRSPYPRHQLLRFRLAAAAQAEVPQVALAPWLATAPIAALDPGLLDAIAEPEPPSDHPLRPVPEWVDDRVHPLPEGAATTLLERLVLCDRDCEATLAFGSDDGIGVWLDGERVLARRAQRAAQPDQEFVTLPLTPGQHRLRVAIVNTGGIGGFCCRLAGVSPDGLRPELAAALQTPFAQRTADQEALLREDWRQRHEPGYRQRTRAVAELQQRQAALRDGAPRTMVMRERAERRPSFVLQRGRYDLPGEPVTADTPRFLPPLGDGPHDRLALARWLCRPDHPLTARVTVQRLWQQVFGRGLVDTPHDFGTHGAQPSHPELLDWLARELIESGWDLRHMLRLCVTSATYRQSSACPAALRARDPDNRWLARGNRHRLDAECLRDQALSLSGLLVERIGGPSVRPYQPAGIWEAVAFPGSNTERYVQDHGDALHRRSLYTFWKRTAPPALLRVLDAPSRETCVVLRERTDTPLQALALLNDTGLAEAARAFAARLLRAPGDDAARLALGFRACTARAPTTAEMAPLHALLQQSRAHYRSDRAAAARFLQVGESPLPAAADPAELAAFAVVAGALFNLDATLSRS